MQQPDFTIVIARMLCVVSTAAYLWRRDLRLDVARLDVAQRILWNVFWQAFMDTSPARRKM